MAVARSNIGILSVIISIIYIFSDIVSSQSCDKYTDSVTCATTSLAACKWVGSTTTGSCKCASEVKLDILFGIDTSGSIGRPAFQTQKQFVEKLVTQGINNGSRIGFYMFNTYVNQTKGIQTWTNEDLITFARGMWWSGGFTNTPQLLDDALIEFARTYESDRQQVLVILTDGNPCLPGRNPCFVSVCSYQTQLMQAGIRLVVIGVGDGLDEKYMKCLVQSGSDWIPVSGYSTQAFDSIMGSISNVLCPQSKEFKVTEVKAEKKPSSWNYRWGRFVEVYNSGIDFSLTDIGISGLITMSRGSGPDITVSQGQYLVFYDAADAPFDTSSTAWGSTPTCHLCDWDASNDNKPCDLSGCQFAGSTSYVGVCFCANAVYVACGNTETNSGCSSNYMVENSGAADACSVCTFNDNMDRENWNIDIFDEGGTVDQVIYGAPNTGSWIVVDDGFSLELGWKGAPNDYGTSWMQGCRVFGTPGSDPYFNCPENCVTLNSTCGDAGYCNPTTGNCVCDQLTGYYPQCQSKNQGCIQCAAVPTVSDCVVVWRKNGTDKYAYYNWTTNVPSQNGGFFLQYFDGGKSCPSGIVGGDNSTGCDVRTKPIGSFSKTDAIYDNFYRYDNYYAPNYTLGGYVYAFEAVCDTSNMATATHCDYYWSDAIPCIVITQSPTLSPTLSPTQPPTPQPTNDPTMSPTFGCPLYNWLNNDVCHEDSDKYYGKRCTCTGKPQQCCLQNAEFIRGETYDGDRIQKADLECSQDSQLKYYTREERDLGLRAEQQNEESKYRTTSEGYILSEGSHTFIVDITGDPQPGCKYTINWKLDFVKTDCEYESRRRRRRRLEDGTIECDPSSTELARAGLDIDNTEGQLIAWGTDDVKNLTVTFEVTRLDCDTASTALGISTSSTSGTPAPTTTTRRRRLGDASCFDNVAIFGNLIIINASSDCQPDCYDGRIYPFNIPVWYNYYAAEPIVGGHEKELPAWLWWLIAALVIFLAILALLLYKYWWKNRIRGAALNQTQAELDAAIFEQETGFGHGLGDNQVNFNAMATNFNPNAPAGNINPNAPPTGYSGARDFIRPNVEKPVFKQEFGPSMQGYR